MAYKDCVAVLDAGSQFSKLIDKKILSLSVFVEILPLDTKAEILANGKYKCIIITGGPHSVNQLDAILFDPEIFSLKIPILGICYGMQLLTKYFGGKVETLPQREDGQLEVQLDNESPLFKNLMPTEKVLLTHGDSCTIIPNTFKVVATSKSNIICAISYEEKQIYGVQFHPEVDLSINGLEILKNFVIKISNCTPTYTFNNRLKTIIENIKNSLSKDLILLTLVSGGIDSAVCASIISKALPNNRQICLHVDTGFMRHNETKLVLENLEKNAIHVNVLKASIDFLYGKTEIIENNQTIFIGPLHSVSNPELKRHIIGDTFVKVTDGYLRSVDLDWDKVLLVQGTLRPDLIESSSSIVSSKAQVIKTHHNDTGLIRSLRLKNKVIEPLKDFHKDEVREIGKELGLSKDLYERQPFPGPGLAIRILCGSEPVYCKDFHETQILVSFIVNYASILAKTPHPVLERINTTLSDLDKQTLINLTKSNEYRATLVPIKSVGVQGDGRSYKHPVVLSSDKEPYWEDLKIISEIIPKICHSINRITFAFGESIKEKVFDITPTFINPITLNQIRLADVIVNNHLNQIKGISQVPVILIPVHFDRNQFVKNGPVRRSIVIRPFITNDFMTGQAAIPGIHIPLKVINEIVESLGQVEGISRIIYDLTSKPPGTTEWE